MREKNRPLAEELQKSLEQYLSWLEQEEKSRLTVEKYGRDIRHFLAFAGKKEVTKELLLQYKDSLLRQNYAVASINSMVVALNRYFEYLGRGELRIKLLKYQRQVYCPEEKEISREEYSRLVKEARRRKDDRLSLILQTIASTGIRIGELKDITVTAVREGKATVRSKNKSRTVFLPGKLKKYLSESIKKKRNREGPVFQTRRGKPLDRCSVWRKMKELCLGAKVKEGKVFPHNLRHLFARTYYQLEKDIAKLSDLLGHSSIETTRIYIMTSGREHRRQMEKLRLIM